MFWRRISWSSWKRSSNFSWSRVFWNLERKDFFCFGTSTGVSSFISGSSFLSSFLNFEKNDFFSFGSSGSLVISFIFFDFFFDSFLAGFFVFFFVGFFMGFSMTSSGSSFFVTHFLSFSFSEPNMEGRGCGVLNLFGKVGYNNCFKEERGFCFMLTFSDIYEAMRKEKYSENLQILLRNFLVEVSGYFAEKKEFLNREDDLFSDVAIKGKKKLDNAVSSFRDLLRIRKKKILNLAFVASQVGISKKDFENLLGFEKDLFEELVRALERAEKNQVGEMNGGGKEKECRHRLVRFLDDLPEFLNAEGNPIGPFAKGEVANLECEIVPVLEGDKKIEIIDY